MSQEKLSPRESQIMEILYNSGPSTTLQVTEKMPDKLTSNAVRTFLTILESKGAVKRTKKGREFIYEPATDKNTAAKSALSKVLDVFFDGSLSDAVAAQFNGNSKKVSQDEIKKLEQLIKDYRAEK